MKYILFSLLIVLCINPLFSQDIIQEDTRTLSSYDLSRKNNIKIKLSPLTAELTYERGFQINQNRNSIEIGLGTANNFMNGNDLEGYAISLRFGFKSYISKTNKHALKGFYLKPELFTQYAYRIYNYSGRDRDNYFTSAIILNLGYQFIFFNRLSLDFGLGFGVAYSDFEDEPGGWFYGDFGIVDTNGYRFGIMKHGASKISPCLAGSIKLGFLF